MHPCTPSFPICLRLRPTLPLPQVGADGCLVEALTLVQELGDVLDVVGQQFVLNEILDALEGVCRAHDQPPHSHRLEWRKGGGVPWPDWGTGGVAWGPGILT